MSKTIEYLKQVFIGASKASFIILPILLIVFAIVDKLNVSKDFSSGESIVNNENIQFAFRQNELKFRDSLVNELNHSNSKLNINIPDSFFSNEREKLAIRQYLAMDNIKNGLNSYSFEIPVNKRSNFSLVIILDKIRCTYSIDFKRLQEIIESSKEGVITPNILKFGNYIKTEYYFEKKYDRQSILLISFIYLSLCVLVYFLIKRIAKEDSKSILETVDGIRKDKAVLDKIASSNIVKKIDGRILDRINKTIERIEHDLGKYPIDDILQSVIYEEVKKSEEKSSDLYSRSTTMLVLGLFVAIVGVTAFYISLPHYNNSFDAKTYLAITIRPALLLIFIQSISFYLLRQYRLLIGDYKYFHKQYLVNFQLLAIYQLLRKENLKADDVQFVEFLKQIVLKYYDEKNENKKEQEEGREESGSKEMKELVSKLIDKMK